MKADLHRSDLLMSTGDQGRDRRAGRDGLRY